MKVFIPFAVLAFAATSALANHSDGNPELQQSILNVHDSHFPHKAGDSHEPAKGSGNTYGSVLLDQGTHTPHTAGDSHEPEKGQGDTYGSALHDLKK